MSYVPRIFPKVAVTSGDHFDSLRYSSVLDRQMEISTALEGFQPVPREDSPLGNQLVARLGTATASTTVWLTVSPSQIPDRRCLGTTVSRHVYTPAAVCVVKAGYTARGLLSESLFDKWQGLYGLYTLLDGEGVTYPQVKEAKAQCDRDLAVLVPCIEGGFEPLEMAIPLRNRLEALCDAEAMLKTLAKRQKAAAPKKLASRLSTRPLEEISIEEIRAARAAYTALSRRPWQEFVFGKGDLDEAWHVLALQTADEILTHVLDIGEQDVVVMPDIVAGVFAMRGALVNTEMIRLSI